MLNSVIDESSEKKDDFINKVKKLWLKEWQEKILDRLLSSEEKVIKLEKKRVKRIKL